MAVLPDVTTTQPILSTPTWQRVVLSAARYLAGKALTIFATIFVGVLITVLLMNYPAGLGGGESFSPFERYIETQIDSLIKISIYNNIIPNAHLCRHRDSDYTSILSNSNPSPACNVYITAG